MNRFYLILLISCLGLSTLSSCSESGDTKKIAHEEKESEKEGNLRHQKAKYPLLILTSLSALGSLYDDNND